MPAPKSLGLNPGRVVSEYKKLMHTPFISPEDGVSKPLLDVLHDIQANLDDREGVTRKEMDAANPEPRKAFSGRMVSVDAIANGQEVPAADADSFAFRNLVQLGTILGEVHGAMVSAISKQEKREDIDEADREFNQHILQEKADGLAEFRKMYNIALETALSRARQADQQPPTDPDIQTWQGERPGRKVSQ